MSNIISSPLISDPVDVSHSELKRLGRCSMAWYLKYVLRLQPKQTKPAFILGGTTHEALAWYYGPTTDPSFRTREFMEECLTAAYKERLSMDLRDPDQTVWKNLYRMLIGYWEHYDGVDWDLTDTEIDFKVPIFDDSDHLVGFIHGIFDGIWIHPKNQGVWIVDHKTAKRFRTAHLEFDPQTDVYAVAGGKLFGERFKGLMFNMIRSKAARSSPNYMRVPVIRSQTELRFLELNIANKLKVMGQMSPDSISCNFTRDCNWDCTFTDICRMLRQGLPLKDFIAKNYSQRPYKPEDSYD